MDIIRKKTNYYFAKIYKFFLTVGSSQYFFAKILITGWMPQRSSTSVRPLFYTISFIAEVFSSFTRIFVLQNNQNEFLCCEFWGQSPPSLSPPISPLPGRPGVVVDRRGACPGRAAAPHRPGTPLMRFTWNTKSRQVAPTLWWFKFKDNPARAHYTPWVDITPPFPIKIHPEL